MRRLSASTSLWFEDRYSTSMEVGIAVIQQLGKIPGCEEREGAKAEAKIWWRYNGGTRTNSLEFMLQPLIAGARIERCIRDGALLWGVAYMSECEFGMCCRQGLVSRGRDHQTIFLAGSRLKWCRTTLEDHKGLHTNFISVYVNASWLPLPQYARPELKTKVSEDVVCKTDSPMIVLIANGTSYTRTPHSTNRTSKHHNHSLGEADTAGWPRSASESRGTRTLQ